MLDFIILHDTSIGDADIYPFTHKARSHLAEDGAKLKVDPDGDEYAHFPTLDDARVFIGEDLDYGIITEINN